MKFVESVEGCWLGRTPVSIVRTFALVLLFFPIAFAEAAVETSREGASGYSGTQDTFLEENTPDTARGSESLVKVENDPPQVQHGLIRFDNIFGNGAGQIPLGSIINSTTLTVIDATPFLSDAVDGDVASYTAVGTTIDAGDSTAAIAQLNINGDSVWAILFSVKMPLPNYWRNSWVS